MRKRVILLNGPSSAGKSTLAGHMSKSGYGVVSIDDYLVTPPGARVYEDDVFAINGQLISAARAILENGGDVIIDHVMTSARIFGSLTDALGGFGILTVRVTCPPDELRRREAARGDRRIGTAEETEKYLYPQNGYDLTIDTHKMTMAECESAICEKLQGSAAVSQTKL